MKKKLLYKTPPSKLQIQALYQVARFFNVKLIITYNSKDSGIHLSDFETDTITLNLRKSYTVTEVYSSFFHELAHLYNKYYKYYPYYHRYDPNYFNRKEWGHFFRTMKRAELFTEKKGRYLMNIFFPDIPYLDVYTKNGKDTDWQMNTIKEEIKSFYNL